MSWVESRGWGGGAGADDTLGIVYHQPNEAGRTGSGKHRWSRMARSVVAKILKNEAHL